MERLSDNPSCLLLGSRPVMQLDFIVFHVNLGVPDDLAKNNEKKSTQVLILRRIIIISWFPVKNCHKKLVKYQHCGGQSYDRLEGRCLDRRGGENLSNMERTVKRKELITTNIQTYRRIINRYWNSHYNIYICDYTYICIWLYMYMIVYVCAHYYSRTGYMHR